MSRDGMLAVARSQIGYEEGRRNATKYGAWYGLDHNPWCDMFLAWCADQAGELPAVGRFAYTPSHANFFRVNNRWGLFPRVGAIVFFKWPGFSRISHVGIVEAIDTASQTMTTIEGNTNALGTSRMGGMVQRVRRSYASSFVAGFGYPDYTAAEPERPVQGRPQPSGKLAVDGSFGPKTVTRLQDSLNKTGARPALAEDGDFGPKSKRALQARLNHIETKAGRTGLAIDGDVGPKTVRALQRRVGAGVDGDWGSKTTTRLQIVLNSTEL